MAAPVKLEQYRPHDETPLQFVERVEQFFISYDTHEDRKLPLFLNAIPADIPFIPPKDATLKTAIERFILVASKPRDDFDVFRDIYANVSVSEIDPRKAIANFIKLTKEIKDLDNKKPVLFLAFICTIPKNIRAKITIEGKDAWEELFEPTMTLINQGETSSPSSYSSSSSSSSSADHPRSSRGYDNHRRGRGGRRYDRYYRDDRREERRDYRHDDRRDSQRDDHSRNDRDPSGSRQHDRDHQHQPSRDTNVKQEPERSIKQEGQREEHQPYQFRDTRARRERYERDQHPPARRGQRSINSINSDDQDDYHRDFDNDDYDLPLEEFDSLTFSSTDRNEFDPSSHQSIDQHTTITDFETLSSTGDTETTSSPLGRCETQSTIDIPPSSSSSSSSSSPLDSTSFLPTIDIIKDDIHIPALIDTGSAASFISPPFAKDLGLKIVPDPGPPFKTANGSNLKISGIAHSRINLQGQSFPIKFFVAPGLSSAIIIGSDFLSSENAKIDYQLHQLHINNLDIPFSNSSSDSILLSMHRRLHKPASSEKFDDRTIEVLKNLSIDPENICPRRIRRRIDALVNKHIQRFSIDGDTVSSRTLCDMTLDLTTDKPLASFYRKQMSFEEERAFKKIIQDYVAENVIVRCQSEYNAPAFLVPKKDKSYRLVVDYRLLNQYTKRIHAPMPRIDRCLDLIAGRKFYCKIDLSSAFHHIAVPPHLRKYLAFSTPFGQYTFSRLAFGLVNSPMFFSDAIARVLEGLPVVHYQDDIIISADDLDEICEKLEKLFERCDEFDLKINTKKSIIVCTSAEVLGHVVSANGIAPSPEKVRAIKELPIPKNVREVRRIIGMFAYLRRGIKNLSAIGEPLFDLLKKNSPGKWTQEHTDAFERLKQAVSEDTLLHAPDTDTSVPYEIEVDSSYSGIGAVLKQKGNIIAFASQTLNDHQKRYPSYALEAYGAVWALEKFKPYTDGHHIVLWVDNSALQYIRAPSRANNRKLARWLETVNSHDIEVKHRPGKEMVVADALSRAVNSISANPSFDLNKLRAEQQTDEYCIKHRDSRHVVIKDGILCRKSTGQIIVPATLQKEIITLIHDSATEAAHRGTDATANKIKEHFVWYNLYEQVKKYVGECIVCQRRKVPTTSGTQGHLMPTVINAPWYRIGIDFVGPISPESNKKKHILVIVDAFTKYALAFALENNDARSVADTLINNVFPAIGIPVEIISDNGSHFRNSVITELCISFSIRKLWTAPYRPSTNGETEKTNHTLCQTISMFVNEAGDNWATILPLILLSYNSTVHSGTGATPFELLHGRKPITPLDLQLGLSETTGKQGSLNPQFSEIYDKTVKRLNDHRSRMTRAYEKKTSEPIKYNVGDTVCLRLKEHVKKFDHRYSAPFVVIAVISPVTVRLRPVFGNGRTATANINNIKPCIIPSQAILTVLSEDEIAEAHIDTKKTDAPITTPIDRPFSSSDRSDSDSDSTEKEFTVDRVLAARFTPKGSEFFVSWKGFGSDENSWVHQKDCNFHSLIADFFNSRELRRIP